MDSDYDSFDDDVADELLMALSDSTAVVRSNATPNRSAPGSEARIRHHGTAQNTTGARIGAQTSVGADLEDFEAGGLESSAVLSRPAQTLRNPSRTFHQTTLMGRMVAEPETQASQSRSSRVYRGEMPPDEPTHHALDREALKTWVYPMNLGPIRDYQFSIVKNGLFNNTLVALPTGLGKTFIAATVILNFFRWTKTAQMVFVAPTKPLASQQVEACLNIAGIPRSQATLLTGEIKPVLREGEWEEKRLFFMTPQTLMNDLSKGYADPKKIVLLVVDEAHRATGDYAYVKVIEFLRRFSKSFRVLALTATPGSTVEGVQDVIDNLGVSHVEIRTEESIDIRSYVHSREIDRVILEPSDEMMRLSELFSKALKPLVSKISQQNIYTGRDPMSITTYGLLKARQDWMNGPGRHANQGIKMMLMAIFTILQSLAHAIKLLNFHGIRPFYDNLSTFRAEAEAKGEKGSKYKRQLIKDPSFQEMMDVAEKWLRIDSFAGHPKLTHLCDNLLNHFMDAGEGSSTRAIVFSEYRDSAEEITRILNVHKPMISASLFVGQADSKKSEGMSQKKQIETIEKFRGGTFNVLVATSIGEEGLDIGQVDLIICYDASSSPIRMLQRMGRTGRKRAGKITLLLMKGKEEDNYIKAQDNYEKMQKLICEGSRFNFRYDLSSRIVPRDIKPEVDKRVVEIPIENTQDTSLPEPRARSTRGKKASKKKFNMPDGVETGFSSAAAIFGLSTSKAKLNKTTKAGKPAMKPEPQETDELAPLPSLKSVLLSAAELAELNKKYRDLPFFHGTTEEISMPSLAAHPDMQRVLRPVVHLKHGSYTKRCVRLFKKLSKAREIDESDARPPDHESFRRYLDIPAPPFAQERDGDAAGNTPAAPKRSRSPQIFTNSPQGAYKRPRLPIMSKRSSVVDEYASGSDGYEDEDKDNDDEDGTSDKWDDEESLGSLADFISDGEANERALKDTRGFTSGENGGGDGSSIASTPAVALARQKQAPDSSVSSTTAAAKSKPFFVPLELPGTQQTDEDDEMPDVSVLVGKKGRQRKVVARTKGDEGDDKEEEEEEEEVVTKRPAKRRGRRPVFEDSESD